MPLVLCRDAVLLALRGASVSLSSSQSGVGMRTLAALVDVVALEERADVVLARNHHAGKCLEAFIFGGLFSSSNGKWWS
jgi:hypothetical protein